MLVPKTTGPAGRSVARLCPALATLAIAVGCFGSPYVAPFEARLARPLTGEIVLVESSLIVFDASGSLDRKTVFPEEKALLEAFVAGMPPGTYHAGLVVLGGREKDQLPPRPFDRFALAEAAHRVRWTGRETPLAKALSDHAEVPGDPGRRSAVIIFSDGVPTRYGKYVGPEETLTAARRLLARHDGALCFHTIGVGSDPRGPELLQQIAGLSECGSHHAQAELADADALYLLQQRIYNGPAPPPVPRRRRVTDLDRDGVDDALDRCPRTPFGASVDDRGCWVIEDYVFETNSARIVASHESALDHVVEVLLRNPDLRVRLDGHTDDTGTSDYNFELAERRATAVSQYLQTQGVDAARLEVRGFGSTRPIASNGSEPGRRKNRRVELSVIDW